MNFFNRFCLCGQGKRSAEKSLVEGRCNIRRTKTHDNLKDFHHFSTSTISKQVVEQHNEIPSERIPVPVAFERRKTVSDRKDDTTDDGDWSKLSIPSGASLPIDIPKKRHVLSLQYRKKIILDLGLKNSSSKENSYMIEKLYVPLSDHDNDASSQLPRQKC